MGQSTYYLAAGAGCREVLCQGSVLRLTQESNAEGGEAAGDTSGWDVIIPVGTDPSCLD